MALAGLYDYQAVVLGTKVKVYLFHLRYQRLHKINGDKAAHSTCHLVQQAGRLVPVVVFRELADMGVCTVLIRPSLKNVLSMEHSSISKEADELTPAALMTLLVIYALNPPTR